MKSITWKSTLRTIWGLTVSPAVPISGTIQAFESVEEMRNKGEYPSESQILKFKNAQIKAADKQKVSIAAATNAGLVKPTLENDAQLRLKNIYKTLLANGQSEVEARKNASAVLNIEWADEDEDEDEA